MAMFGHRGVGKNCPRTPVQDKTNPWPAVTYSNNKSPGPLPYPKEKLRTIFKRFDADGDGRLTKQELTNAFTSLGSRLPCWRAWRALRHADSNGDGYISEEEFDNLLQYGLECDYTYTMQ